jgi:hypothetical protein
MVSKDSIKKDTCVKEKKVKAVELVLSRFLELPKSKFRPRLTAGNAMGNVSSAPSTSKKKNVIFQYFASHHCAVCDALSREPICDDCRAHPQSTVLRGAIHQLLNIILKLRILVLLPVSTLPYVV